MEFQALECRLRQVAGGLTDANRTLLARMAAELVERHSTIFESLEWPLPLRHVVDLLPPPRSPPPRMHTPSGRRCHPGHAAILTFATIAAGEPASTAAITNHYLTQTLPKEVSDLARYYTQGTQMPGPQAGEAAVDLRHDLHPLVAKGLGLDPERAPDAEKKSARSWPGGGPTARRSRASTIPSCAPSPTSAPGRRRELIPHRRLRFHPDAGQERVRSPGRSPRRPSRPPSGRPTATPRTRP